LCAQLTKPPVGKVLLSSGADREGEALDNALDLRPHEGLVIEVAQGAEFD
jgi:hypothetical protein